MKLISTLKTLTVVSLILTGVSTWAQSANRTYTNCLASCNTGSGRPEVIPGTSSTWDPSARAYEICKARCDADRQDAQQSQTECTSLYQRFNDASSRAGAQCSKEGLGNMTSCSQQIASCSGMMSLNGTGDDPMAGLTNVLGMMMMSQQGGAASGCVDQSDNSVQQQQNNIDNQVYQIRKEISKSVAEKAKKKGEVAKKNAEIEKEKIKAQQEADKIKVQNQKDLGQKKAAIDKLVLELKAKQFGRLMEINKIGRELANSQFKIQQFMIQFADKQVQTKCGSDADSMAQAKRTGAVPKGAPPGMKPSPRKLTKKDQQEIDLAYQTCLQVAALSKKAELKKIQDEQAAARDKISVLQESNKQDNEAIEAQKIEFEEAKKIAVQEDKNAEDVKLRTDAALDKSLAEFKTQIDEEIRGIEEENKERMNQISVLMLQKQNIKPKYSSLPGLFEDRARASQAFQTRCCGSRSTDPNCGDVRDAVGYGGDGLQ